MRFTASPFQSNATKPIEPRTQLMTIQPVTRFRLCLLLSGILPLVLVGLASPSAFAQSLNIVNNVQRVTSLNNTTASLAGRSELHVTGSGDPIPGCTIHLNSPDSWFFMSSFTPSQVAATFLSRVRVSGTVAVIDQNVRVVQFDNGTVVIPHAPTFAPLEVFDGRFFAGASKKLNLYTAYNDTSLGTLKTSISSFRLKRGYMATVAQQENGSGFSKVYVAQDGDIELGALPGNLDNQIRFVRVFPWRWVSKKGIAGDIEQNLNVKWIYNWNISRTSPLDWEYVPIRQTRYWPGLDQDWKYRGATHLLGHNEPNQADQANMPVAEVIAAWPELQSTGLRLGAPAVSDGGVDSWLYPFIDAANAAGLRVDFVPVHYYRRANPADPAAAASQFYNYLKAIHDRVQRPLWITEWNNGANWTADPDPTFEQQEAAIAAMVEMLDNAPFVERYALYNWVEDVRRVVWDDGWLTAAGVVYRDNVTPNSHLQEMPDSGASAAATWLFEGNPNDSSGNGREAMITGSASFAAGKSGLAVALDGSDSYLRLPAALGDSTDFTFAGWVYWSGGGSWQRIFDFGDGNGRYLCLTPKSGDGNFGLRFMINGGGGEQQLNHTFALPLNTWTHVAVTIGGNTGKLFVNGSLVNTNNGMTVNPADVGSFYNYLGKSQYNDPLFKGRLDDLRFSTTALPDAEIAALAAGALPQFSADPLSKPDAAPFQTYVGSLAANVTGGPVTFSKLSGPAWLAVAPDGGLAGVPGLGDCGLNTFMIRATTAAGNTDTTILQVTVRNAGDLVARYSFNTNASATAGFAHGSALGSPAYVTGKRGKAIDLDGVDNYVTLPAGVANLDEITIATWVTWDGGNAWQRIFDFGNGHDSHLIITPKSGDNRLLFMIRHGGSEQTAGTTTLALNQWTHVAITIGGNVASLYVNGLLASTVATSLRPSDIKPVANFIGKSQFDDPLFNGRIDEFLIFSRALTGAEVLGLKNGQAPVFAMDPVDLAAATIGQSYEQLVAGFATDPDPGDSLVYSKASGPLWLSVSPAGRISGVPSARDAGMNRFVLRVTDSSGFSDDATVNILVPGPVTLIGPTTNNGSYESASGLWDAVDFWTDWTGVSTANNDSGVGVSGTASEGVRIGFLQPNNAAYNMTSRVIEAGDVYRFGWDHVSRNSSHTVWLVWNNGGTITPIAASAVTSTTVGNGKGSTYVVLPGDPAIGSPIGLGIKNNNSNYPEVDNFYLIETNDSDNDGLDDTWETTYFTNLSQTAGGDFDHDGTTNLTEFRLGLIPNKSSSRFVASISGDGTIQWPSVAGITFTIKRSTTLAAGSWSVLEAAFTGTPGTASYNDPSPPAGRAFYKIEFNP
jgi:Glycosyl hydrolase catalytic core/Concanavalin A-like lectin/glucanases superfamily/Putative Ig domain